MTTKTQQKPQLLRVYADNDFTFILELSNNSKIKLNADIITAKYSIFDYCNDNKIDTTLYLIDADVDIIDGNEKICLNDYLGKFAQIFDFDDWTYKTKYIKFEGNLAKQNKQYLYKRLFNNEIDYYFYRVITYIQSFEPVYDSNISDYMPFWDKYNSKVITNEVNRLKLHYCN